MARRSIPTDIQERILIKSRRRCCICFGLNRDASLKSGQIAHLDRDAGNNFEDNLTFMCLVHHDIYDSITSQSKNFTAKEVKAYLLELTLFLNEELVGQISLAPEQRSADAIDNTGELEFSGDLVGGRINYVTDIPWRKQEPPSRRKHCVTLIFRTNLLLVLEENGLEMHGMNVTFEGEYRKAS